MSRSAAAVESPCMGVCRMERRTGWCEGCLRSIDEIVAWAGAGDTARRAVLAALPERARQWQRLQAEGRVPARPPAALGSAGPAGGPRPLADGSESA